MRRPRGAVERFLLSLAVAPFAPRRVAAAHVDAPPATVWGVHLAGLVILYLVGWVTAVQTASPGGVWWMYRWGYLWEAGQAWPALVAISAMAVAFGVVAAYAIALVFLCWAPQDEPLGDTWRHALRTVRVFTPAVLLPAVLLVLVLQGMEDDDAVLLFLPLMVLLPLWMLWILLRALSVDREVAPPAHEPLCEACGYVLLHLPWAGRCPECGKPISESLAARGGSSRARIPAIAAWFGAPEFFGQLSLEHGQRGAGGIVCALMAVSGFVGWSVFLAAVSSVFGDDVPLVAWWISGWLACGLMQGVFCGWCAIASVCGLVASRMYGRNLTHAVFSVVGYTSGYFVVWAFVAPLSLVLSIGAAVPVIGARGYVVMSVWALFNVLILACYVRGVWRRVCLVRYGNWGPTLGNDEEAVVRESGAGAGGAVEGDD